MVIPIAAYRFQPSGLEGEGFQNMIAIQPGNPDDVVLGADVAATHHRNDPTKSRVFKGTAVSAGAFEHFEKSLLLNLQPLPLSKK